MYFILDYWDFIMKYAFFALAFTFFAIGNILFGQDNDYDIPKKIFGGYLECKIFNINYFDLKHDSCNKYLKNHITYNSNGDITENIEFTKDSSIIHKKKYSYNLNKQISQEIDYSFNKNTNLTIESLNYYYDSNTLLTKIEKYFGIDSLFEIVTFNYNEDNNISEECAYNSEKQLTSKSVYTYNDDKLLVEKITNIYSYYHKSNIIDKEKKWQNSENYKYSNKKIIEINGIYCNGENSNKIYYFWDEYDRIIKEYFYSFHISSLTIKKQNYDKNNNIIKKEFCFIEEFCPKTFEYIYSK